MTDRPDDDLLRQAQFWENAMYSADEPQGKPAEGYLWRRVEEFPIADIASAPDDWVEWMKNEIRIWRMDGDPNRFDDILNEPIREEVVMVEIDGKAYIWDGYHRIGGSVMTGRSTVPAIVGVPDPNYVYVPPPLPGFSR